MKGWEHTGDQRREEWQINSLHWEEVGKNGANISDVLLNISSQNHLQGPYRYCSLTSEDLKFQILQAPLLHAE